MYLPEILAAKTIILLAVERQRNLSKIIRLFIEFTQCPEKPSLNATQLGTSSAINKPLILSQFYFNRHPTTVSLITQYLWHQT